MAETKKVKIKDHGKCLDKVRKGLMKENPNLKAVAFDLSNIVSWHGNNRKSQYYKTGQRIQVTYDITKKDAVPKTKTVKSFVGHEFCPFCGEKYQD